MRKILMKNGVPYPMKLTAKGQAAQIAKREGGNKEDYLVAEVDGGFIIVAPDISEQPKTAASDVPQESAAQPSSDQSDAAQPEVKTGEADPAAKKKHRVTEPWKKARKLAIPERFKDPNYDYKLPDMTRKGRINQLEEEGFVVDKDIARKMKEEGCFREHDNNLDGTYKVAEHIVMKISKEGSKMRKEYYQNETKEKIESKEEQLVNSLEDKSGIKTYHPKVGARA